MFAKVKIIAIFLLFPLMVGSIFAFSSGLRHPEKSILGEWKEVYWTYERIGKGNKRSGDLDLASHIKEEISKDLIIHESEKWKFSPKANLTLFKKGTQPHHVTWRLKGRGHVLKLTYDDKHTEYYNIHELTAHKMVLHFENEVHARSIVKIVFRR